MQKSAKIIKAKVHPYVLVASMLVVIGMVTAIGGILHYGSELNNSQIPATEALAKSGKLAQDTRPAGKKTPGSQDSPADNSNQGSAGTANTASTNAAGGSSPAYTATTYSPVKTSYVKVSLSVNGSFKGNVTLKSTANQCDVLRQAQESGLISLDMRYNPQYKTYGVYVIDGIGDPNSVWWVYKVNGKSPPYGCSYMKVHGGDSVNWQYIKS